MKAPTAKPTNGLNTFPKTGPSATVATFSHVKRMSSMGRKRTLRSSGTAKLRAMLRFMGSAGPSR